MDEKITDLLNLAGQKQEDFKKDGKYDFTKTPTTDNGGINLLHYAVMDDDFELVKYMVENGANIFAETIDGTTVFHLLAKKDGKCNNDMKNYLIEKSGKTCKEIKNMGIGMQNPVFRWNTKCKETTEWSCDETKGGKSKRRRNKKSTKKSRRNRKSTTK